MNLLGKILTLLIMVMSLLFLFVAFMVAASHQNWKNQAEENKIIADQRLENTKAVQADVQRLQKIIEQEKVSRQLLLAQLESQWQAAKRNYAAKDAEVTKTLNDLDLKTRALKQAEERLQEQDGLIVTLNTQVQTFIENVAEEHRKVIELQNQVYEKRGQVDALERQKEKLAQTIAMADKVLKTFNLTINSLTDPIPPKVNGLVKDVRANYITITIGSDDGIKKGHAIDIHRDGKYVGHARVTTVDFNQSVALLDPKMTNVAPQVNDQVTTEWSRPNVTSN